MNSLAVGFDIGGTNISTLRIAGSEIEGFEQCLLPKNLDSFVEAIGELVLQQAQAGNATELSVGIGCAGSIDAKGKVLISPNVLYLNGIDLKEVLLKEISEKLKKELPSTSLQNLKIENDVYAATSGELVFGENKLEDFIFLAFGTGIGAGRVIAGKQYAGANNFWGEVGHIFITEQNLEACGCGQKGCWEQMASGLGLERIIKEAMKNGKASKLVSLKIKEPTGQDFAKIFSKSVEDPELRKECMEIVQELAVWMARGIKNLMNVCDPGCIILSGGLLNLGDELLQALNNEMGKQAGHNCTLKLATHIEWGGAMGAAHLGKAK